MLSPPFKTLDKTVRSALCARLIFIKPSIGRKSKISVGGSMENEKHLQLFSRLKDTLDQS
jgi:hypothetical protein